MAKIPGDLKYTTSHEWIKIDGDIVTVGITDHAQEELGDVVFVDLPTPGRNLAAGDPFGSIESVKAVSDLYAPVSGEVVEVNPALGAQTELINTDPYGSGYLMKIKMGSSNLPDNLLSPADYETATS
jgi:glycine cleavage system H protein